MVKAELKGKLILGLHSHCGKIHDPQLILMLSAFLYTLKLNHHLLAACLKLLVVKIISDFMITD